MIYHYNYILQNFKEGEKRECWASGFLLSENQLIIDIDLPPCKVKISKIKTKHIIEFENKIFDEEIKKSGHYEHFLGNVVVFDNYNECVENYNGKLYSQIQKVKVHIKKLQNHIEHYKKDIDEFSQKFINSDYMLETLRRE